jgi:dipeptidyl aminopeptidase/acylaminoacyl peptidase
VRPVPGTDSIGGVRHTLLGAPEPFAAPLRSDAEPRALANLSGFDPALGEALARVETLSTPALDDTDIQYYLMTPRSRGDAPLPLLFWIHGGPISQFGDDWHWRWNALAACAAGYAVCMPNPRGSTGFGQELIEGIWNNTWGAACYEDLMVVVETVAARPEIDADRMIAMGGSFGGYMSNWIGASTDRFACIVTHASLYDLAAFYGVTDVPAWMQWEFGFNPYEDPAAFDRYSPSAHITNWKTPTLVIHGERDYRVPVGEGLALFEALQLHGVPSELLVFPDENHWILKPRNIAVWYRTFLDFVAAHVGDPRG